MVRGLRIVHVHGTSWGSNVSKMRNLRGHPIIDGGTIKGLQVLRNHTRC
jgi:hypothetical protein